MTSGEDLCLACGLCCDGALFDNVRLGTSAEAAVLGGHALPVRRSRGRVPITFVRQPCAALCADGRCRVYADRPTQCRAFACAVLNAFTAGHITAATARARVRRARRLAEHVRGLLRDLGDHDEDRSLSERFRRTTRRLESTGADAATADRFAALGQAVHAFKLLAHAQFYTRPPAD